MTATTMTHPAASTPESQLVQILLSRSLSSAEHHAEAASRLEREAATGGAGLERCLARANLERRLAAVWANYAASLQRGMPAAAPSRAA